MRRNTFFIEARGVRLKVFRVGETARISAAEERQDAERIGVAHTHFTYEIFFVTDGTLKLVTEEGNTVYEREAVIIPPRIGHYSVPSCRGSYCLLFSFEEEGTALEGRLAGTITALPLDDEYAYYIRRASERLDEKTVNAEADAELLITLVFNWLMQSLTPGIESSEKSVQKHINTIEHYINSHLREAITLGDVSAQVYLSTRQVSRIIAREYGCGLPGLVAAKRLSAAEILVKNTDDRISDIARAVGIGSENYFYTLFKRKYGVSPLQYRKQNRASAEG